jgi:hypothetical protein
LIGTVYTWVVSCKWFEWRMTRSDERGERIKNNRTLRLKSDEVHTRIWWDNGLTSG